MKNFMELVTKRVMKMAVILILKQVNYDRGYYIFLCCINYGSLTDFFGAFFYGSENDKNELDIDDELLISTFDGN